MIQLFGENGPPLVGKVNNDRPFMHHNGWIKKIFLLKNACRVNHDRPFVKYDRPFIGYIVKQKWHGDQGKLRSMDGKL